LINLVPLGLTAQGDLVVSGLRATPPGILARRLAFPLPTATVLVALALALVSAMHVIPIVRGQVQLLAVVETLPLVVQQIPNIVASAFLGLEKTFDLVLVRLSGPPLSKHSKI
jgi:hypothetical protein